jgi:hypothetical protein
MSLMVGIVKEKIKDQRLKIKGDNNTEY